MRESVMRALLDTNIIIHRETSRIVNENIGKLFFWLDKLKYQKYVHPITVEELQRHINEKVVKTMEVKLQSYYQMKEAPPFYKFAEITLYSQYYI
jgi:predicted nucleic acid-binding protein